MPHVGKCFAVHRVGNAADGGDVEAVSDVRKESLARLENLDILDAIHCSFTLLQ